MTQTKLSYVKGDDALSCILRVEPGDGRRAPKRGKTGPVRDFLADQDFYYQVVFNHVKDCKAGCAPDLVLERHLERRRTIKKFHGETTSGLCRWAKRYEKIGASPDLVRRFFVLSANPRLLCERTDLSAAEVVEGVRVLYAYWVRDNRTPGNLLGWFESKIGPGPTQEVIRYAATCYDNGKPLPPDEELLQLAEVAAVMSS